MAIYKIVCRVLLSTLAIFLLFTKVAQSYPLGPITLVVPNPPGGSSDANARILSDALAPILKQPVIVNFKPGDVSKLLKNPVKTLVIKNCVTENSYTYKLNTDYFQKHLIE